MSNACSGFDPLDDLVESFLERYRRGERPSLTEYAGKHPELAERIRSLFPSLVVMEELGSGIGSGDRAAASRRPRACRSTCCQGAWAITSCSERSAPAAWGSSTRRSRNRWAGTWPSRSSRSSSWRTRPGSSGSGARPAPRPGCTTPHRAGLRSRRARWTALLHHAVHSRARAGHRPARGQAVASRIRATAPTTSPPVPASHGRRPWPGGSVSDGFDSRIRAEESTLDHPCGELAGVAALKRDE